MELEPKEIANIIKSIAHQTRIEILDVVSVEAGLTVGDISETLDIDIKSISAHLLKLTHANLVDKEPDGQQVRIYLTDRGRRVHEFITSLE